ncbi:MAG: cysteine hydrolase family protein [Chloroflexi bacterium]|nr:cysteine hydrolase family protein [Chloroflexota bacterium]
MVYENKSYGIGTWRKHLQDIPWFTERAFPLEPSRTALMVIDMTRFQCDKDAPFGVARTMYLKGGKGADYYFATQGPAIAAIRRLIDAFRQHRMQVVYTTSGSYFGDGRDRSVNARVQDKGHLAITGIQEPTDTPQFQVIPELQPQKGDLVIHKVAQSAFVGSNTDLVLRNMGIDTLVFTGAATHACVESSARVAVDLSYKVVLVDDACASQSPLFHDLTMLHCAMMWGRVLSADQVIEELSARLPAGRVVAHTS